MDSSISIKIMSFNIRYLNRNDNETLNKWDNRKQLVVDIVKKYDPDIIGFQEVLISQFFHLKENLPEYESYAVYRDDGVSKGESVPIFYKKDKIKVLEKNTFWLSSTPQVPSKRWKRSFRDKLKYEKHGLKRICSTCLFELKDNPGQHISIYNTHFPLKIYARLRSIDLINKVIKENNADIPNLLMGDFNFDPHTEEYNLMASYLNDSFLLDKKNVGKDDTNICTFHDFTGRKTTDKVAEKRIDNFWINDKLIVEKVKILYDNPLDNPGIYPSDHYPLFGKFGIQYHL